MTFRLSLSKLMGSVKDVSQCVQLSFVRIICHGFMGDNLITLQFLELNCEGTIFGHGRAFRKSSANATT